jgi:hypothetical protein
VDRASGYEPEGRGFESLLAHLNLNRRGLINIIKPRRFLVILFRDAGLGKPLRPFG